MFGDVVDCVIVGARAAGATAAMLLARQGRRVLLLDDGELGADTLSTHFIWPRGVRRLAAWGLLDRLLERGTPPINHIRFDPGTVVVDGELEPMALCPRRTVLDRLLVEAAIEAGVDVRHGVRVRDLAELPKAELVVGADGRHSTLAGLLGAEIVEEHAPQTGGFYAYFENLPMAGCHFTLRDGRLTYAWPTNDGLTLIYVGAAADRFDALRELVRKGFAAAVVDDDLRERLPDARQLTQPRGFAREGPRRRVHSGDGWALIGDAASFKDPTAGMGISEAFEDAAWLAGELTGAEREAAAKQVYDQCRLAASLREPSPEAAGFYRAAAADPATGRSLMKVLGGPGGPRDV